MCVANKFQIHWSWWHIPSIYKTTQFCFCLTWWHLDELSEVPGFPWRLLRNRGCLGMEVALEELQGASEGLMCWSCNTPNPRQLHLLFYLARLSTICIEEQRTTRNKKIARNLWSRQIPKDLEPVISHSNREGLLKWTHLQLWAKHITYCIALCVTHISLFHFHSPLSWLLCLFPFFS